MGHVSLDSKMNPGELNPNLSFTGEPDAISGVSKGTTGTSGGTVEITVIDNTPEAKDAPKNIAPDWSAGNPYK